MSAPGASTCQVLAAGSSKPIADQNRNFSANWKFRCGSVLPNARRIDASRVGVVIARDANLRVRVAKVDVVEEVDGFDADLELASVLPMRTCLNIEASVRQ